MQAEAASPRRPAPSLGGPVESAIASQQQLASVLGKPHLLRSGRLGEILLEQGVITLEQRDLALELQQRQPEKRFGEVLAELGMLPKGDLYRAICQKLGVPFVDVARFDVDPNALKALPEEVIRADNVLPLCFHKNTLVIAVPDVLDSLLVKRLAFAANVAPALVMAPEDEIRSAIQTYFGATARGKNIEELASELRSEAPGASVQLAQPVSDSDNTLVRLVNKMIVDAHACGASDIHIECNPRENVLVRFRNDGQLTEYLKVPQNFRSAIVSRIKIMADMDISEKRHAQDGRINFRNFAPVQLELRVVTYPTREGFEDVVLRLLAAKEPMPLERLGLPERTLKGLQRMVERPHGLILAVGPTGSGKTTTLHSLISLINKPGVKILTAENPIEITQPGLRQVQVNTKSGWDFASIMRSFLRADPDVIMVGEMRDKETAGIAVEASLTGHLVFSTLHTNSAAETVVRLLDMGIDPFSFTDSLLGVLAQRLARRLCKCRIERPATASEVQTLADDYCFGTALAPEEVIAGWHATFGAELRFYERQGCRECRGTGYKGRVGLYELLAVTPDLRKLMLRHSGAADLQALAIADGMRTLKQDGLEKCLQGLTDVQEVHAVAM